jgi:RNA recognition motif-containing protein
MYLVALRGLSNGAYPSGVAMPTVFIDPLPSGFTSADLAALLRPFGNVMSAKVAYDSLGYSLQFGHVEMQTEEGTNNACEELHGKHFRDAILTVLRADDLSKGPAD